MPCRNTFAAYTTIDHGVAMRLGVFWEPNNNARYRAIEPMKAMERRGHAVVWPTGSELELRALADCDVVHVYRRSGAEIRRKLAELGRGGPAITYDNDDDMTMVPKESPAYKRIGGLAGQRVFSQTVRVARLAHAVTTPTELLAEKYRRAGIERVEVISNYLAPDALRRHSRHHQGVVIGWIAGLEHRADANLIGIADALRRLIASHDSVRVECIGVNLGLPERYRHDMYVNFGELPTRMASFDIGIAPLADIPFNRARSDIKLKEYAAAEVPWLASPVGPYLGLGEAQGGRLVPDDGWFDALGRLVTHGRERRRLARKGRAWAKRQTIEVAAARWERLFGNAARRQGPVASDPRWEIGLSAQEK